MKLDAAELVDLIDRATEWGARRANGALGAQLREARGETVRARDQLDEARRANRDLMASIEELVKSEAEAVGKLAKAERTIAELRGKLGKLAGVPLLAEPVTLRPGSALTDVEAAERVIGKIRAAKAQA